uniref:oligosaccharide flippase family protein n=1 Tax=Campylobacter sp. TaxID=205 RepID=UPI0027BA397A
MIAKNKVFYQTTFLFVAQIFGMGSAFMSNILMAKAMGVANFGVYSFTVAVIMFLSIFFEFGYIASISRLLIKNDDPLKEKELFGLSLIV